MAQVINTNALSMTAQNNLNKSQDALGTSIERLSSGLRINSAKDDAAGMAISNRMTAQINGLTQASRNANDGISIAQTTEGALNEVNDNLQNIRRLTVQAQNGTNSESDLESIQNEIDARLAEIDRIAEQTEFNGIKVLNADQTLTIQVGANDGQTIDIQLTAMSTATLGLDTFSVVEGERGTPTATEVMVGETVKAADGTTDVTVTQEMIDDAGGHIYKLTDGGYAGSGDISGGANVITFDENNAGAVVVGAAIAEDSAEFEEIFGSAPTQQATANPLETIDAALAMVDSLRSELGAVQNRFSSVISNTNSTIINLSESRSRIMDADFAAEVSEMGRAQILQSAGVSVLAQANQVPQNVLNLLR